MDSDNSNKQLDNVITNALKNIKNREIQPTNNPFIGWSIVKINRLYNYIEIIKQQKLTKQKNTIFNLIDKLSINDLTNLQKYFLMPILFNNNDKCKENLLLDKMNILTSYDRNQTNNCNTSLKNFNLPVNKYVNKYECDAKQNSLGMLYKTVNCGCYQQNNQLLENIGLTVDMLNEKFPGDIRNVNIESVFNQQEMTNFPGQRELTEIEMNRFILLQFNPQNVNNIVWSDNMPRGGYSTRTDRLSDI